MEGMRGFSGKRSSRICMIRSDSVYSSPSSSMAGSKPDGTCKMSPSRHCFHRGAVCQDQQIKACLICTSASGHSCDHEVCISASGYLCDLEVCISASGHFSDLQGCSIKGSCNGMHESCYDCCLGCCSPLLHFCTPYSRATVIALCCLSRAGSQNAM